MRSESLGPWVCIVPEQPRDRIASILCAASAVAVTLRPRRDTHTVPSKIYEALVKGEVAVMPGIPESFNVLLRELQSLCLDVELLTETGVDG